MSSASGLRRALVVSPTPTWPLDYGNRKRIFAVTNALKARCLEIHFVHYASEPGWRRNVPDQARRVMNQQWDFVDHVYPSGPIHEPPENGEFHEIDEWWDPTMEAHLSALLSHRSFDLVLVNYVWLSRALELAPENCMKVLDTHDKFSGRDQLLLANKIQREFFYTSVEEEIKGVSRADLVYAIKEEEELAFKAMGVEASVQTLPHIDLAETSISPCENNGYVTFGFVGARNNINLVNLRNFLARALPLFERHLPPLKLKIAGSICQEMKSSNSAFIELDGYFDEIQDFYDSVDAVIVPMEFSTGLKIKVAEALSFGKPLVSHVHASEGFPTLHDWHRCQSFDAMVTAMIELAYAPELLPELGVLSEQAHCAVQDQFDLCLDRLSASLNDSVQTIVVLPGVAGGEESLSASVVGAIIATIEDVDSSALLVCLSPPGDFEVDGRIRYLQPDALWDYLRQSGNKVVLDYAMSDGLTDFAGRHVVRSMSPPSGPGQSTPGLVNRAHDASLPLMIQRGDRFFEGLQAGGFSHCVMIGGEATNLDRALYRMITGDKNFRSLDFKAQSLEEAQRWFTDLARQHRGLPAVVIVKSELREMHPLEGLVVDFFRAYGVAVIDSWTALDIDSLRHWKENRWAYIASWSSKTVDAARGQYLAIKASRPVTAFA